MEVSVSENFMYIYENLNCFSLLDKINELSEREKIILILAAIDNHDIDDDVVFENLEKDKPLLTEITNFLEGKDFSNHELVVLSEDDKTLNNLTIEFKGLKWKISNMPEPHTKEEVRDIRINKISE